jgi:hypothetical protein
MICALIPVACNARSASKHLRASRDDPAADGVETATAREELRPSRAELAYVITWRRRRAELSPIARPATPCHDDSNDSWAVNCPSLTESNYSGFFDRKIATAQELGGLLGRADVLTDAPGSP